MAKLVFLGRLEDVAGMPELVVPLKGPAPLSEILGNLPDDLAVALTGAKVRVAVNGAIAAGEPTIQDADEVAFLPPVSGG